MDTRVCICQSSAGSSRDEMGEHYVNFPIQPYPNIETALSVRVQRQRARSRRRGGDHHRLWYVGCRHAAGWFAAHRHRRVRGGARYCLEHLLDPTRLVIVRLVRSLHGNRELLGEGVDASARLPLH